MRDQTEFSRKKYWWRKDDQVGSCSNHLMPGSKCPKCGRGALGYDGLFNLSCSECGHIAASGAFT